MNDQEHKEIVYLQGKLSSVVYNPQRFRIMIGDDKFLFGSVSAKDNESPFGKLSILLRRQLDMLILT